LFQLARKTSDTDTAKALLKLAAENSDLAEEAARPVWSLDSLSRVSAGGRSLIYVLHPPMSQ
jgi:hypothetical protein